MKCASPGAESPHSSSRSSAKGNSHFLFSKLALDLHPLDALCDQRREKILSRIGSDKQSQSRPILTRKTRRLAYRHNLLGWTITAIVCLIRDCIWLQVAPTPSTGNGWPPAGTEQRPFIFEPFSQRQQVRPVTVRAEARQISSQAFWTLNAMANTGRHDMCR